MRKFILNLRKKIVDIVAGLCPGCLQLFIIVVAVLIGLAPFVGLVFAIDWILTYIGINALLWVIAVLVFFIWVRSK
jgi:hypothetical protein